MFCGWFWIPAGIFWLLASILTPQHDNQNQIPEILQVVIEAIIEDTIESEIIPPIVDEIVLKQQEMRNTTVFVHTRRNSGSGTIIDCIETDTEGVFEYRVLTNAHVTHPRFITYLRGVNSLRGNIQTETVDTGCKIITFDYVNKSWYQHDTKVLVENRQCDISILSFISDEEFVVARIADNAMLERVRVFDEVFSMSCQLGRAPSPTIGIVSQILTGENGGKEWVIYANTAQITPGSSGGGLFKKYGNHYYLIGIPFKVAVAYNGQLIPHLAHAISIVIAQEFIDQSSVSYP